MTKDWKLYALHILDCLKKIKIIMQRGDIFNDFVLYDAVLRSLQTLSESTTHLPARLKSSHPNIDWKAIKGFRNVLVHDYLGEINNATVKKIITDSLPALESATTEMLGKR